MTRAAPARVRQLDGLRGLAALLVVGYHFLYQSAILVPSIGEPIDWATSGRYGVELFFVISGFVILQTLERSTVRGFVASRFSRLFPTYWAAVVLTFVVMLFVPLPGLTVSWWQALVNLTMLQQFFSVPHVDGVYWTLEVELAFYLQAALLWYSGAMRGRRAPWVLSGWAVVSVVVFALRPHLSIGDLARADLAIAFQYIPIFVSGIAVLRLSRDVRDFGMWVVLVVSLAMTGAVARLSALPWWIVLFPLLTLLVLKWRPLGTTTRPLLYLGDISYALYLIHEFVGYALIVSMERFGLSRAIATAVALIVIVAVAAGLTRWVDQPVRKPLRVLLAGSRRPDMAPTASSGL